MSHDGKISPFNNIRRIALITCSTTAWLLGCSHLLTKLQVITYGEPQNNNRRRHLWNLSGFMDPQYIQIRNPFGASDVYRYESERFELPSLNHYSYENIILAASAFTREIFFLYYDPIEDEFLIYLDENRDPYYSKSWSPIWSRLNQIMPIVAFALRNNFPDRFQGVAGGSSEFIAVVSSGDTPKLTCDCVQEEQRLSRPNFCLNDQFAPILHFGSVYKDKPILPNTVTMPVWAHLPCFKEWQHNGQVCEELQLRRDVAGVLGGADMTTQSMALGRTMPFSEWDALIPTLIWRGSDSSFLNCVHSRVAPLVWDRDIKPRLEKFGNHAKGLAESMLEIWDQLTPRWRTVALMAIAQAGAADNEWIGARVGGTVGGQAGGYKDSEDYDGPQKELSWIDSKFTVKNRQDMDLYSRFQKHGVEVAGDQMTLSELSKYRYHLDLGGSGGTSWFGTIEKLAMPGVLFHHRTSTKDYFHEELVPWVHYIPVEEDLSDLREMYDFAESHPKKAQQISLAATEYVKERAKPYVMKATYERYFIHSLKKVVDSYQPMDIESHNKMKDWLSRRSLVGKCNGRDETCQLNNWRME